MRSATVKKQPPSLHSLIKRSVSTRKERQHPEQNHAVPQPTEKKISDLNNLGKQYPFCVNFKHKQYDPL